MWAAAWEPAMTQEHNDVAFYLAHQLASHLDRPLFKVRSNTGRLQTQVGNAYITDAAVVPVAASRVQAGTGRPENLHRPVSIRC